MRDEFVMPDFTSARMQRKVEKLGAFLRKQNLGAMEQAALGCYMAAAMIGRNRRQGDIDDQTAERMLQSGFEQMRAIAFAGSDKRH